MDLHDPAGDLRSRDLGRGLQEAAEVRPDEARRLLAILELLLQRRGGLGLGLGRGVRLAVARALALARAFSGSLARHLGLGVLFVLELLALGARAALVIRNNSYILNVI